jgi:hypothetical protein
MVSLANITCRRHTLSNNILNYQYANDYVRPWKTRLQIHNHLDDKRPHLLVTVYRSGLSQIMPPRNSCVLHYSSTPPVKIYRKSSDT